MRKQYNVTRGVNPHNSTTSCFVNERFQNKLTQEFPRRTILIRTCYHSLFLLNESQELQSHYKWQVFAGLLVCFFRGLIEDMLHLGPRSCPAAIQNELHYFQQMPFSERSYQKCKHNVAEEVIIPDQPSQTHSIIAFIFLSRYFTSSLRRPPSHVSYTLFA